MNDVSEAAKWNDFAASYDHDVYSITRTPEKRKRLKDRVRNGSQVLIVGCGSAPYLQADLLHERDITLIAADFNEQMLQVSRQNFQHPRLLHQVQDTRALQFLPGTFDSVMTTNSIIPPSRSHVQDMFHSVGSVLKNDGEFMGYFPSFTAAREIRDRFPEILVQLDDTQLRCHDTTGWQSFHTEDSLQNELTEAGFSDISIERVGAESQEEIDQLTKVYSAEVAQHLWEFFVCARK